MFQHFRIPLQILYLFALGIIFTQFVQMAQNLIGLNHEGALWFYSILNDHMYVTKAQGWRWSDIIWQLPTIISAKFLAWIPFKVNLYLLSYTYLFHPVLAVLLCYFLVRKEKESVFYMTFPLLSLGTAVACNLSFVVGTANGAISLYWPLFFIFCFKDTTKLKYFTPAVLLLLALSVSYEPAMAFMPILGWVILKNCSGKPCKSDILFLFLIAVSIVFQFVRVSSEYFNQKHWVTVFWIAALNESSSHFHYYLFGVSIILFAGMFIYKKVEKPSVLFIGSLLCLLGLFVWSRHSNWASLMESRENRASAIPISAAIAISMAYGRYFLTSNQKNSLLQYITQISIFAFLGSWIFLTKINSDWDRYTGNILKTLENELGCIYVEKNAIPNSMVFTSILIQKTEHPKALLIPFAPNCSEENAHKINPCDLYINTKVEDSFVSDCRHIYITSNHINLGVTKKRSQLKQFEGKLYY